MEPGFDKYNCVHPESYGSCRDANDVRWKLDRIIMLLLWTTRSRIYDDIAKLSQPALCCKCAGTCLLVCVAHVDIES